MNMKKLITIVVIAIFAFASNNLFAQSVYTGAAEPAGYSNTSHNKVPGTQQQSQHQKLADGNVICLPCAIPEGEPDIPNDGVDVTNGGCNNTPPFSQISIWVMPFADGVTDIYLVALITGTLTGINLSSQQPVPYTGQVIQISPPLCSS